MTAATPAIAPQFAPYREGSAPGLSSSWLQGIKDLLPFVRENAYAALRKVDTVPSSAGQSVAADAVISPAAVSKSDSSSPNLQSVRDDLNRFLAGIERRALRIAEISTSNRDDALDIVQDAMVQLAVSYADRPSAEWAPLFHRILENKICDWQRRQSVRRRLFGWGNAPTQDEDETDPLAELPDLSQPAIIEQLRQEEAMKVLRGAIAELPKRQRQAFILRVWEGLSVEETANVMGCSDGSVKTHLSRALASLREKLEEVWS